MTQEKEVFFAPTLRGEVDALFRRVLGPLGRRGVPVGVWNPQLDVTEEDDRFVLEMDLPGVRREDVTIEVRERNLTIGGSRQIVRRTEGARYRHFERISGSFQRMVPLPAEVDEGAIRATLEGGILKVELPKRGRRA